MDSHRILSTTPNAKEKICPHLLITNIGDKQLPWHLIPTIQEIKHLAFKSTLQQLLLVPTSTHMPIFKIWT